MLLAHVVCALGAWVAPGWRWHAVAAVIARTCAVHWHAACGTSRCCMWDKTMRRVPRRHNPYCPLTPTPAGPPPRRVRAVALHGRALRAGHQLRPALPHPGATGGWCDAMHGSGGAGDRGFVLKRAIAAGRHVQAQPAHSATCTAGSTDAPPSLSLPPPRWAGCSRARRRWASCRCGSSATAGSPRSSRTGTRSSSPVRAPGLGLGLGWHLLVTMCLVRSAVSVQG